MHQHYTSISLQHSIQASIKYHSSHTFGSRPTQSPYIIQIEIFRIYKTSTVSTQLSRRERKVSAIFNTIKYSNMRRTSYGSQHAFQNTTQESYGYEGRYEGEYEEGYDDGYNRRRNREYQRSDLDALAEIEPYTTLMDYLTARNPPILGPMESANLRRRNAKSPDYAFIWWDVRNTRQWNTFNLQNILATPDLDRLLRMPIPQAELSEPFIDDEILHQGDRIAFLTIVRDYFCAKVTAALSQSIGTRSHQSLSMVLGSELGSSADIAGVYQSPSRPNGQIRVAGFVKSCREWNTMMQAGGDEKRREFLQVLSQLQRYMREHNTRYGYVLTEQELVCVRLATDAENRPIFGCLDIANPIQWNQHGTNRLTICLSLWFLHFLAKRDPLPDWAGWEIPVPSAEECSRRYCMAKDPWVPDPKYDEIELARVKRGWGEAEEPYAYGETFR
ncbi:hypothetical protein EYR41_010503 [Orbilia oligospora]|uniref:Uncharacterized protein n=1 Tax=Orbilia oligospora TaxID=2813651 RepID=A0A8H2DPS0_ORBOL|nr:hypothetical protein EYR41_010503 [Orbilia oligospora]